MSKFALFVVDKTTHIVENLSCINTKRDIPDRDLVEVINSTYELLEDLYPGEKYEIFSISIRYLSDLEQIFPDITGWEQFDGE